MTMQQETAQFIGMVGIAAATFLAFLVAGSTTDALVSGGLVLALAVAIHFGRRRSETLGLMGGLGDERTENLSLRASAFVGNVFVIVLPAVWLVSIAQGEPNDTLAALCAVGGVSWVAALVWLSRRS